MSQTPNDHNLEYRSVVHKTYYVILAILVLVELIIIRININKMSTGSTWEALVTLALASTVPLSIFIRLFFYVRPQIFSTYKLQESGFTVKFGRSFREVAFDQVIHVRRSKFMPQVFSWYSLKLKSGQKFVILSALLNGHNILEDLLRQRPDLETPNLNKYLLNHQKIDLSWERVFEQLKNWKWIFVKYLLWPTVLSVTCIKIITSLENWAWGDKFLLFFGILFLLHLFIGILISHWSHLFLNSQAKLVKEGFIRNLPLEKKIAQLSHMVFFIISLFIVFILTVMSR